MSKYLDLTCGAGDDTMYCFVLFRFVLRCQTHYRAIDDFEVNVRVISIVAVVQNL